VRSDVAALIGKQTRVKSQEARGTCSIFSAVAMVESLLIIHHDVGNSINYSEEFLQFLISPGKSSSGSNSFSNIPAMARYGLPVETEFPYIGEEWTSVGFSTLSKLRCGSIPTTYQPSCLVGHRDTRRLSATNAQLLEPTSPYYDPELLTARDSGKAMQGKFLFNVSRTTRISSVSTVYGLLDEGIPVLLDIDFYYGAWNHRKASDFGIKRNMTQWYGGIVTYPEPGSLDRDAFAKEPAGHSVLIVGYDNEIVVQNTEQMADGTAKEFSYQGVYIFKNSWGTGNFGEVFTYGGQIYDGYGMITQKYANQIGDFFHMLL